MQRVGMYWEFYKSTLVFSIGSALMFSVLIFPLFLKLLPIAFMTVGTFVSLLYKEYSRKKEYFFYYNKSISKISLFIFSASVNIIIGILFIVCCHG